MKSRIETIKNNSYRLPTVREQILIENKFDRKPIQKAICRLSAEEIEISSIPNHYRFYSLCKIMILNHYLNQSTYYIHLEY